MRLPSPIKGYSPELMVSEVYSWSRMSSADPGLLRLFDP
ncbi:hypothetical protein AK812_SmicGene48228, partial [Symbiodinium microadriaticum]